MEKNQQEKAPHVVIFPFPAQGHINSMLGLARLLCLSDFRVTFLNSDYNHDRLLRCTDVVSQAAAQWPGFRFKTISDGLPPDHPRTAPVLMDLIVSLRVNTKPLFKEMLTSYSQFDHPVTCVIADGFMATLATDVADEVGIPILTFRTISASSFWCYFNIPNLIAAGEIPFGDSDMDKAVTGVPGMETVLRRRDLPSSFRAKEATNPAIQILRSETLATTRASALILNTFEDIEGPILSQVRTHCHNTYAIDPLHALLESLLPQSAESALNASFTSASLWKEDRSCIQWLDSQPQKSVLYVSFGSYAVVTRSQLLEFWHGLVNSGTRFLWVLRSDLVSDTSEVGHMPCPQELQQGTGERGFLVEWAPQQEVLSHSAVGGFLTHGGWNSTIESVFAGMPMICWPFFGDQQLNARCVERVWRIGLDMKDTCERGTVERMVRELMDGRKELRESSAHLADLTRKSVSRGGSSHLNFERLIHDVRAMCS